MTKPTSKAHDYSAKDSLKKGFAKIGIKVQPINSSDVLPVKPSIRTSSAATIRKMRKRRASRGSKLELNEE
jgi:hypothetical protein